MRLQRRRSLNLHGAMLGFIAVSQSRTTQDTKTSGGAFRKTVTTTVKGLVKSDWYVATPVEMQQEGAQVASLCVSAVAQAVETTSCDDPAHVAISGVSVTQWKGGNMPMDEDLVYQWVKKKSSFTIAFFAVILAILTWGLATALIAASPAIATAVAGASLGASSLAAIAGIGYAVASTALHSGGGLTQAQAGFFGSTGNGVLNIDLSGMSEQSLGLAEGVRNRHIRSAQGYNLTGSQKLFKGSCPENKTVAECWNLGLDAGQMWRGDAYQEVNMTLEMRTKYAECQGLGFTGAALMQCAAPNATSWQ